MKSGQQEAIFHKNTQTGHTTPHRPGRTVDTEFGADAKPPNTHKQKQVSKVLVFTHLSSHSSVNPPAMSTKDSKKRLHQAREATDGSVGVRGRAAPGRRTTKQTERSTHRGRETQRQKCSGPISGAAPGISMAPGSGSRRAGSPRISGTTVPTRVHAPHHRVPKAKIGSTETSRASAAAQRPFHTESPCRFSLA